MRNIFRCSDIRRAWTDERIVAGGCDCVHGDLPQQLLHRCSSALCARTQQYYIVIIMINSNNNIYKEFKKI